MGIIYKITNKVNNKIYIGQTITTIENRWKNHVYDSETQNPRRKNILLHLAIKKYGESSFLIEQIEECNNNLLDDREKYWINYYNSYFKNGNGYNMTLGGSGSHKYTEEEIKYLWDKGLKEKEIAIALGMNVNHLSDRLEAIIGKGQAQQRHINSIKKAVLQYDIYGNFIKEWDNINEAEKNCGISSGGITKCCKKERTIANGYLWKYSNDLTPIEEIMKLYALNTKCCGVDLIDDNGNIISTYNSGKEAELDLKLPRGKVSEVCNGKRKQTGGYKFQWSYPLKRQLLVENKTNPEQVLS